MSKDSIQKMDFVTLSSDSGSSKVDNQSFENKIFTKDQITSGHTTDEFQEFNSSNINLGFALKSFLKKFKFPSLPSKNQDFLDNSSDQGVLALEGPQKGFNPNALSSIFSFNSSQAGGISRVFRKSITFLVIQLGFALALNIVSVNFFSNLLWNFFVIISTVAVTNVFFIIVADRSYVWLNLLSNFLLVIIVHSFLGLGFSPITILLSLLFILYSFLAYADLEKIQLSSRLFSISHLTSESTRILLTGCIILISLGIFNSIQAEGTRSGKNLGSRPFLERVVFNNRTIMDYVFIGKIKALSINNYLIQGDFQADNASNRLLYTPQATNNVTPVPRQATFGDFLQNNYEFNQVLTEKERQDIQAISCRDIGSESQACLLKIEEEKNKKLLEWKNKAYSNLPYELTTPLTVNDYRTITTAFYLNKVAEFETEKQDNTSFIDSSLLLIPLTSIIPALIAILVAVLFFMLRFIFSWMVFITTWIIWKVLLWSSFVQIDVETVEAEIISI